MEDSIFDIIEYALARAGYRLLDKNENVLTIRHPDTDEDYEIKITSIAP